MSGRRLGTGLWIVARLLELATEQRRAPVFSTPSRDAPCLRAGSNIRERLDVLVKRGRTGPVTGTPSSRSEPLPDSGDPQPVVHQVSIEKVVLHGRRDRFGEVQHLLHGGVAGFD